jgi:hypothetical protein
MSRSRMFRNDEPPETPSPRTTIVGGRPPEASRRRASTLPEAGAALPPVPTGIQRLLRLASVDPAFRAELLARRDEVAAVAAVELTASERAIVRAAPEAQLAAMIATLPPPASDRREFLREAAASAVVLLGGAALGGACDRATRRDAAVTGGAAPDVPRPPEPPRPDHRLQAPGGAAPDVPRPPEPPRPVSRDMVTEGGAAPHQPPPRPDGGAEARPTHNETQDLGGIAPR